MEGKSRKKNFSRCTKYKINWIINLCKYSISSSFIIRSVSVWDEIKILFIVQSLLLLWEINKRKKLYSVDLPLLLCSEMLTKWEIEQVIVRWSLPDNRRTSRIYFQGCFHAFKTINNARYYKQIMIGFTNKLPRRTEKNSWQRLINRLCQTRVRIDLESALCYGHPYHGRANNCFQKSPI